MLMVVHQSTHCYDLMSKLEVLGEVLIDSQELEKKGRVRQEGREGGREEKREGGREGVRGRER